jgi:hypothetical protein
VSARVLTCEQCGGPLVYGAPACAYCHAPQQWERLVSIERGSAFVENAFVQEPMLDLPREATRREDGILLDIEKRNWHVWHRFGPHLRNGCFAVRGRALDPHGIFGIYARMHTEGQARAAYELMVYPAHRAWRMRRTLWWPSETHTDVVLDWEHTSLLAGVGSENEVELRCADSVFQVVFNGHRVATLIDASFGFGMLGWVAGSMRAPARLMLHAASAWRAR